MGNSLPVCGVLQSKLTLCPPSVFKGIYIGADIVVYYLYPTKVWQKIRSHDYFIIFMTWMLRSGNTVSWWELNRFATFSYFFLAYLVGNYNSLFLFCLNYHDSKVFHLWKSYSSQRKMILFKKKQSQCDEGLNSEDIYNSEANIPPNPISPTPQEKKMSGCYRKNITFEILPWGRIDLW